MKTTLIIADADRLLAAGVERLLVPEFDVLALAHDANALFDLVRRHSPDIVLHGLPLPPLSGTDAIYEMRRISAKVRIVVLTGRDDPNVVADAFRAGASAYISTHSALSELRAALQHAMEGKTYVTPLIADRMIHLLAESSGGGAYQRDMTLRQREVVSLLVQGKSMKEAAAILSVRGRSTYMDANIVRARTS